MNKFNVILTTAIISGFVVLCALSGGNQSANPQAVVIKATEAQPRRVVVFIRADSSAEAMSYARKLKNFRVDDNFGPFDQSNHEYLIRGDLFGIIDTTGAEGHFLRIYEDTLSSPSHL